MVSGQRIEWTYIDGGGFAPTHAQNKPGEHFVMRWSRYRDTMTLTTISPADVVMDPWHRLSGTPSAGYLSKRCPPPAQALVR